MKPRVYVETTVLGYLTARPSDDLVVAGRQKTTREWWQYASRSFDLLISELVHREASAGDPQAARDRLEVLRGLPILAIDPHARSLASRLINQDAVPPTEPEDALHIALAVVNGIEYLVTWNFRHIANAVLRSKIHRVCVASGYDPCTICTPDELSESPNDV